jgi:plastocyanin
MKKVAVAFALVLAAIALVACGSSSSSSSEESSPETTSESSAEGGGAAEAASSGLAFSSKTASAKAGEVTVEFNNPQSLQHDVAIEDSSGETIGETELVAESSASTTVELEPGTYHYYCTVPGHREGGMEGTLTVK